MFATKIIFSALFLIRMLGFPSGYYPEIKMEALRIYKTSWHKSEGPQENWNKSECFTITKETWKALFSKAIFPTFIKLLPVK